MTNISLDMIQHLEELSSLSLTTSEIEILRRDIPEIIAFVDKLGELETFGVDPTHQVTGLDSVWREDIVNQSIDPKVLLSLSADGDGSNIKVPKVL